MKAWMAVLLCGVLAVHWVSCSDDAGGSTGGDGDADADSDGGDTDADGDADSDGDTDNDFGILGDTFRYGINGGHRNAAWGDDVQAELEKSAGCNSQRISLPERHLERWGYEIEVSDMNAYEALGFDDQVAFLTEPIREHSTAPADAADWELAHYIPSNLYEPVTRSDGTINPDNYWGKYVYETVKVYSPWIRVWEIWNEPDYTDNWQDTLTWDDQPPTAAQLPRFNGSIFEYVRMLRVSREAARLADPDALIATGGLGYATFLDAVLRYTDNPEDGSVTDAYPETGGAYFDVLSMHHYPVYTAGNSDAGVRGFVQHLDELKTVLADAAKTVDGIEVTESGAPHLVVGDYPGGDDYAKNYLMKVMLTAQMSGVHGVDWFMLSDGAIEGEGTSPYDYMGLYFDVVDLAAIDEAVLTDSGTACATLGELLSGARFDPQATDALQLPTGVSGGVFLTSAAKNAVVLWVVDPAESAENLSGDFQVSADYPFAVYRWDYSSTRDSETINPVDRQLSLTLSSTPTVFLQAD